MVIDDERLEADIRATLARRDPGPAPTELRALISSRLREPTSGSRLRWVRVPIAAVASIAAVVIVAALIASLGLSRPAGPGALVGSSTPPPVPALGLASGDGLADGTFTPLLQVALWSLAFAATLAVVLRAKVRALTIAGTVAVVGLVWVALNAGTSDAIVDTGMVGSVDPDSAVSIDGHARYVLSLNGDQPFRTMLVLRNASRLPLTLRGMVAPTRTGGDGQPTGPRFVGLGRLPDDEYIYDHVQPFQPVTMEPGARINVAVLGMTGSCAIAPAPETSAFYGVETLRLVYDQLSIVHTAEIPLARSIWVTSASPCPPDPATPLPS